MKKQDSLAFGADVIEVKTSDFKLAKSPDVYTNLTFTADIPRPLSFSKTEGLVWSREFRKPEIAPDLIEGSNSEMLLSLRQLRSFGVDGVSLMGCESVENAKHLGVAFDGMKYLKSLKLKRAFTVERSVRENMVSKVNLAIQNFCQSSLSNVANLCEFESHYNQLPLWSDETWKALSDAFGSLNKLSRVSIKEIVSNYESCFKLMGALAHIRTLESCEIKVLNPEKMHWPSLSEYIENNKNLRVLEIGVFDLNNDPQKEMLEKIWFHSENIQTLGLSLVNVNAPSIIRLFKMLSEKKHANFSKLILEVDTLKDAELIEIHVKEFLEKTEVIDVRIMLNNADVTPSEIKTCCATKVLNTQTAIEDSINEEKLTNTASSFKALVNKLDIYLSSVHVVDDHLSSLFTCFNYLKWLDESSDKTKKINEFYQKFILSVELGKLSHDHMIKMLGEHWGEDESDLFLSLVPVVNSVFDGKEIPAKVVETFRSVANQKCCALQERCREARKSEVTQIFEELTVFYDFIQHQTSRGFLKNIDHQDYSLLVNYLKSQITKSSNIRVDYFKKCVEDQLSTILKRSDPSQFSYWFRVFSNIMTHELLGNEEEIFSQVFSSITNPEFLAQAAFIFEELRQPKNKNSEIFPSIQLKMLSKSLPALLLAKRKGYEDKDKRFEYFLKEYKSLTLGKNRGTTTDAIDSAVMAEVEQMAEKLFLPVVTLAATKSIEKVVVEATPPPKKTHLVPLRDLLRNKSPQDKLERVPLRDLIRKGDASHGESSEKIPLRLLLRSEERKVNVLVNNGSPKAVTQQFQLTENELLDYLRVNKTTCVLELGDFDFNDVKDRDFLRYALEICGALRSFGLKLTHFNKFSVDYLLDLFHSPGLAQLSQCILRVDAVDNVELERVIDGLLVNTSILDLRIFSGDREVKVDEIQSRCQGKIKLLMNPISSDKGKIENKEFEVLTHEISSRLCEEMSSVTIVNHHVLAAFHMCLELDKSSVARTNEALDGFIVKVRKWVELGKISPVAVLPLIELLHDKHLNTQIIALIGIIANRCDNHQIETTLQPIFREILELQFDELGLQCVGIFNVDKNSLQLREILKECSSIIELINDMKYSALMIGEFAEWRDYLTLKTHHYKDTVFVCQGNIKRFVRECASSQAKNIASAQLEAFEKWFRHLSTILEDDKVIDDRYLTDILRSIFANIHNIEQLLKASDVIAESQNLSRSLKISLALFHQAVMQGHETQDEKFQERLDKYMKISGLKVEETNQVLSEIDALSNQLFVEQQAGDKFLYAYLPGKKDAIMFTEEKVLGEGDCGFITIGASRAEVADILSLCINDNSVREELWEEVYEAFLTNNLVPTPEFLKLNDAYEKPNISEKTREKNRQNLVQYCKKEKVMQLYINAYRHKLWLGFKSALLYAKLSDITLYVWAKAEDSQQLVLKGSNISAKPERVIHMLLTSGFIHFNLLVEVPSPQSNYPKSNQRFSIQEFLSHEGDNSWGDGFPDHQSAEEEMSSSLEDKRPVLPSIATNRNRFKLAPLPDNRPSLSAVKKN